MMKQMGIEQQDLAGVKEVIFRFVDKEWIVSDPQVSLVKQAGSESFQVSGTKTERGLTTTDDSGESPTPEPVKEIEIPMEDAALVAAQTGVDIAAAKEPLRETHGDLAAAILKLRHT
jgi:nascent polypeptide-associated complex subunit alpha